MVLLALLASDSGKCCHHLYHYRKPHSDIEALQLDCFALVAASSHVELVLKPVALRLAVPVVCVVPVVPAAVVAVVVGAAIAEVDLAFALRPRLRKD